MITVKGNAVDVGGTVGKTTSISITLVDENGLQTTAVDENGNAIFFTKNIPINKTTGAFSVNLFPNDTILKPTKYLVEGGNYTKPFYIYIDSNNPIINITELISLNHLYVGSIPTLTEGTYVIDIDANENRSWKIADHSHLTNVGTKTHAQIDSELSAVTSKLSGIEPGATADQSGSEIKALYEAELNTNAYTDAEKSKLGGIEANAKDDQVASEIPFSNTVSGLIAINVQSAIDETESRVGLAETKLATIEPGATSDQTAAEIETLYEGLIDTNKYTDSEKSKVGNISVTQAVDLDAIEARVNELDASVVLKGIWDASMGTFPTSIKSGESWIVSVDGTVDGVKFKANDRIIALVDSASTTVYSLNWHKADYTNEVLSVAGRTGSIVLTESDITDFGTYEPAFTKNTGFNKNLGTTSGTVSEGDHTHTGAYEPADGTILKDADIGITVQAYNANTVIEDRTITAEDNAIDFGGITKNYELTATAANITALNITAEKEGTIIIHSAENVIGWGAEFKFKTIPTGLTGTEVFGYFIEDATNIWIGRVQ